METDSNAICWLRDSLIDSSECIHYGGAVEDSLYVISVRLENTG